jgi:hypothetical protein
MFVGHYSAAFAAAALPKAPKLGTLFIGAQLVDLAFFAFVPLGVEAMRVAPGTSVMNPMDLYHMPYTHSLLGAGIWAIGFALILRIMLKDWTPAFIGGAVVLSHWFFDTLVHVPDMTLAGSPPKLGLGLWNHPAIEMPLEIGLLLGSAWLYARERPAAHKSFALPVLIGFLLLVQAINWFGPSPAAVDAGLWGTAIFVFLVAAALASWVAGIYRTSW